jgi:tetratricopeptide (TPR) repeat protein
MDCRKPLLGVLGLVSAVWGCNHQPTVPTQPTTVTMVEKVQDKELPRRAPKKPSVCVAAGVFYESEAVKAPAGSTQQEQFFDQARRAYQQALEIDASYLPAYQALGRLYVTIGDHERAVATYHKGLQKHKKEAGLWFDLGMAHARKKEWEPGLEALRKAVELDPENRRYVNTLGHCLARTGRYDESLGCFRKAVGEAKAHYNLARMMLHMNDQAQARQHLHLALRADPQLAQAQQLLASLDGRGIVPAGLQTPAGEEIPVGLPQ